MFDISWTEFLLIGVVALIVIGPKELPAVLRTLGQWTRKVRSMAAEFQGQFQEAMREAEMADLKKQVDDIAHDIKSYDPLKDVRADVEAAGKDIQIFTRANAGADDRVRASRRRQRRGRHGARARSRPEAVEQSRAAIACARAERRRAGRRFRRTPASDRRHRNRPKPSPSRIEQGTPDDAARTKRRRSRPPRRR